MALVNEKVTDEAQDVSYLMQDTDKEVLKNVKVMAEHLKNLKIKYLEAEAICEAAKKEYDYYASSVLPMAMYDIGLDSIGLASGGHISINHKFRCTPNKNAADRAVQVAWLKQYGLDKLVKEQAIIDGAQIDKLKESGIPYSEVEDINTNKLKAQLCDLLGVKGGVAKIQATDIPECFHFQEVTECEITL